MVAFVNLLNKGIAMVCLDSYYKLLFLLCSLLNHLNILYEDEKAID